MKSIFLTAEWKKLAIANYAIDPQILLPYMPYKTALDTWNGKCYISLVGFRFVNTKLKGLPIPFHRQFEEINLRFYVRYKDASGWKRGVTFIKEIVPRPALTFVANTIYKEKYVTLPTKHSWNISENTLLVAYQWRHERKWNNFSVAADPIQVEIATYSKEEFITEHYWGYSRAGEQVTAEYGVEHPRWKTYTVRTHKIDVEFGKIYGEAFSFLNFQSPDSVMLAEGSEIVVRAKNRIT
jgi:uncharacterized protein YqjF (DUF2071 family)